MSERETITCPNPKCRMVQFRTKDEVCRRCKVSTAPLAPEPVVEIALGPAEVPKGFSVDLMRATAVTIAARRGKTSQKRLASKLGCARTYVSKVENGRAMPNLGNMAKFAMAFRIPLWVLVREIETMQAILTAVGDKTERTNP